MKWNELRDEACPIARSQSVLGDRWTMLILRDVLQGKRRFDQIQASLGLTRHVLADRLRGLTEAGVLRKVAYQDNPPRHDYRLTAAGKELYPLLVLLVDWAERHVPTDKPVPYRLVSRVDGGPLDPVVTDRESGMEIDLKSSTFRAP